MFRSDRVRQQSTRLRKRSPPPLPSISRRALWAAGMLIALGARRSTIGTAPNSGVITAGGAGNTTNELDLVNNSGSPLTVNSVIANNATGTVSISIPGSGTTSFTGANTFTGVLATGANTLVISSASNGGVAVRWGCIERSLQHSARQRFNAEIQRVGLNYRPPVHPHRSRRVSRRLGQRVHQFHEHGRHRLGRCRSAAFLTLTGTSTAANTLASSMTDNGLGATSLTKTGLGTWYLGGTSNFTGPTTVSAGVLAAGVTNAFSPNSTTTVAAGAKLDLNGLANTIGTLSLTGGSVTLGGGTLTPTVITATTLAGSAATSSISGVVPSLSTAPPSSTPLTPTPQHQRSTLSSPPHSPAPPPPTSPAV